MSKFFSVTYVHLSLQSCSCFRQGLKTGMYHLRTRPAAQAIQFTVDQEALKKKSEEALENKEVCAVLKAITEN